MAARAGRLNRAPRVQIPSPRDSDLRRRPWILAGEVTGYGRDHGPLLIDIEPIAWLTENLIDQARRRYHERFDVGRTSV